MHDQPQSYSQYGQDVFLADQVFRRARNGVFLDIGAYDGVELSNTLLFEREYGWTGLCIEANPDLAEKLQLNRRCVCLQAAAAATNGTTDFQVLTGSTAMLSGTVDNYDPAHCKRISREQIESGGTSRIVEVATIRVADVLRKHDMKRIDYASIDIEGGEVECLKGLLDPDIDIRCLSIENNYSATEAHDILTAHGFMRFASYACDDFYKRKNAATIGDWIRSISIRRRRRRRLRKRLKRAS